MDDLYQALKNADAAGDVEAAKKIATYIQSNQYNQPNQPNQTNQNGIFSNLSVKNIPQNLGNLGAGLLRGAGSIGSTVLLPADMINQKLRGEDFFSMKDNNQRRDAIDSGLQQMGADPTSGLYKTGKIASEIAGTSGAGNVLALGAGALKYQKLANALRSGGLSLGDTTGNSIVNGATRVAGGAATGAASSGLIDPESSKTGAILGGVLPIASKVGGIAGDYLGSGLQNTGKYLMQSALKPTIKQRASGEADRAIQTLLDEGLNATKGGVDELEQRLDDTNSQIKTLISGSNKSIGKQSVINALNDTRNKFTNQVSPTSDLNSINKVENDFNNHPFFNDIKSQRPELFNNLQQATLGKIQALQTAGKYNTFAAQQKNLANGVPVGDSPLNQPYFNSIKEGMENISPSAYPALGFPRVPGQYTENMQRVQEGISGAKDAMTAYESRKNDELLAEKALQYFDDNSNKLTVQKAQDLKQGTYQVLKGKFGETGSADTEAQKALARGLKEQIAFAHPEVSALNNRDSDLINALNVTERRALLDGNKNPVGIAGIAHSPIATVGMLADRSALVKSLLGRASYATGNTVDKNKALAQMLIEQATPKLIGVASQ